MDTAVFLQADDSEPVTADEVQAALDRMAEIIVFMGEDGASYLPIYDRLEHELNAMRSTSTRMDQVRQRLAQSRDRRAASLPA